MRTNVTHKLKTIGYVEQYRDTSIPMWHATLAVANNGLIPTGTAIGGSSRKQEAIQMVKDAYEKLSKGYELS